MSVSKYTVGTVAPTGSDVGIAPEPNQNTMICIGFAEIEVYGKNGANWQLIGTCTESDKVVFVPFTTYSAVFFKSNSGEEETMRGVFMNDSLIKAAAPTPASVTEIGDMPAFSAADAGKVLSVDVNGNLAWINR